MNIDVIETKINKLVKQNKLREALNLVNSEFFARIIEKKKICYKDGT